MEEKVRFRSDLQYDLPKYKDLSSLTIQVQLPNTIAYLFASLCMIFLIFMLRYGTRPMTLILLSLFWLGALGFRWYRERSGGIGYKRLLHSSNETPPLIRIILDDSGMKTINLTINQEVTTQFAALRYMMESRNLLVLVDDLKLCHPIDKRTLEGGSREELLAYLRENCPKLKKRIRTGWFGRISQYLCIAVAILALLISLATLLHIPEKLSGQLTNDMTYREMAEELAPLGIAVSDQAIRELEAYDVEYAAEYGEYYEENPYSSKVLDMLYWEGAGFYDEETDIWMPSASGVYWFDLEVSDVSCMYTDFFSGLAAMDESLSFFNVSQDFSSVDWESGTGIVTVSFDFESQHYEINLTFEQAWFDPLMITHAARILDQDAAPEKLWYAPDGQALYLYYGTAEQAEMLGKKTGTIWLDPVNQPLNG